MKLCYVQIRVRIEQIFTVIAQCPWLRIFTIGYIVGALEDMSCEVKIWSLIRWNSTYFTFIRPLTYHLLSYLSMDFKSNDQHCFSQFLHYSWLKRTVWKAEISVHSLQSEQRRIIRSSFSCTSAVCTTLHINQLKTRPIDSAQRNLMRNKIFSDVVRQITYTTHYITRRWFITVTACSIDSHIG